jgi:hypothetical protein
MRIVAKKNLILTKKFLHGNVSYYICIILRLESHNTRLNKELLIMSIIKLLPRFIKSTIVSLFGKHFLYFSQAGQDFWVFGEVFNDNTTDKVGQKWNHRNKASGN